MLGLEPPSHGLLRTELFACPIAAAVRYVLLDIVRLSMLMAKSSDALSRGGGGELADEDVPHTHRSKTGPLGLTIVALPRLSLTSLQLSCQVAAASQPQLADEACCLARRVSDMNGLSHPNIAARQHAPDAHFSARAETLRLAEVRNAILHGYAFQPRTAIMVRGKLQRLRSPVCQGRSACAVLYAPSCASRFVFLRMALLVNDQKQFVLRMINPAIAAALACGYQSYSKSSRAA